ncbi:MAG: hypothetical protein ACAI44_02490, partial [Candidatus Sericytochromatia bacterium]
MKKVYRPLAWTLSLTLLWLSACQTPVPLADFSVKQASQANPAATGKSLVPRDVFFAVGLQQEAEALKADDPALLQASPTGFTTQAYPISTGCYLGCVYSMSVLLGWPAPPGFAASDGLSLDSPDLYTWLPYGTGYNYGISVVELGTNLNGQQIATKLRMGANVVAEAERE